MNARSWASRSGAGAVALIAAIASYSHMRSVALDYGQTELIATLLPFSVDGLVMVGAIAIGDGRHHKWSAWLAFWAGVGASIAANVLAARADLVARIISAWPAIALLLVVEVITRSGHQPVTSTMTAPAEVTTEPKPVSEVEQACPAPAPTLAVLPQVTSDSEQINTGPEPVEPAMPRRRSGAAHLVADAHMADPTATHEQLAMVTGLSVSTVRRYRPPRTASAEQPVRVNGSAPDLAVA